jgi:tripartite-type tricarboxylate transporter receptor subunit TctC
MRTACSVIASAIALYVGSISCHAELYPTRSIKIVVPATPGGAIDVIARLLADKLTLSMGQPVVTENKPGASNNLGTDFVAKSPPDGYNLVIVASSHATNKFLFKQMPSGGGFRAGRVHAHRTAGARRASWRAGKDRC